jgi:hypothetical protein
MKNAKKWKEKIIIHVLKEIVLKKNLQRLVRLILSVNLGMVGHTDVSMVSVLRYLALSFDPTAMYNVQLNNFRLVLVVMVVMTIVDKVSYVTKTDVSNWKNAKEPQIVQEAMPAIRPQDNALQHKDRNN